MGSSTEDILQSGQRRSAPPAVQQRDRIRTLSHTCAKPEGVAAGQKLQKQQLSDDSTSSHASLSTRIALQKATGYCYHFTTASTVSQAPSLVLPPGRYSIFLFISQW